VITALFVLLAVTLTALIIAIIVVSVCIRLEDSQWTLGGPPPGPMRAFTRHVVSFHAGEIQWHTRGVDWQKPATCDQGMTRGSTLAHGEAQPQPTKHEWPPSRPM